MMMSNDNNWNLLEKVTDDEPHIYDAKTDNEVLCPTYVSIRLRYAADELDIVIRVLADAARVLIENDAYLRSEVGGFDSDLCVKLWRVTELYSALFHGHARRELKRVIDAMYGCNAEPLRYNEHGYVDTDIAAEAAAHEE